MDPEVIKDLVTTYGLSGGIGVALSLSIRVFKEYGGMKLWRRLPQWAHIAAIFAMAGALVWVSLKPDSLAGLAAGAFAGFTAFGYHHGTKKLGARLFQPQDRQPDVPKKFRKAMSILVPPPWMKSKTKKKGDA